MNWGLNPYLELNPAAPGKSARLSLESLLHLVCPLHKAPICGNPEAFLWWATKLLSIPPF